MSDKIEQTKTYVLTDFEKGNNKYWKITEYLDGTIRTEWGPVGASRPQTKTFEKGKKNFEKECSKKERKGYSESRAVSGATTRTSVGDARSLVKTQCSTTQKLVDTLNSHNIHKITSNTTLSYDIDSGLFSTPLGIVDNQTIIEAKEKLRKIENYVKNGGEHTSDQRILNEYFMLIPQKVPRVKNKPALEKTLATVEDIEKQFDILDSLQASLDVVSNKTTNKNDSVNNHSVQLELIEDTAVFSKIKVLYEKTSQRMHTSSRLKPYRVYNVECEKMKRAFEEGSKVGNNRVLWHGTRVGNVLSILVNGLIIPPSNASHCTGRMFGNGTYFSDQSTKALNYAAGYWSRTRENLCFMFLCDVAMGKSYTPKRTGEKLPKPGYDSTFAKANISGVMNNEMIVYNTNQVNLKYLVEFK